MREMQRRYGVVGRERELETALAALAGGRHLLLEGPVGAGKTTVARAVCGHLGRETVRVDGDDRCTESRLAGWFDPPLVLRLGYRDEAFVAGPLVRALRCGHVLFLNELNRLPEAAQNLLLPALDEGVLQVPHLGEVRAAEGFQVVATQNPAEYVATGHLSVAVRDRFEHLALGYQTGAEEEAIVVAATGCRDAGLVRTAVRLVRATRLHPRVRRGASVRGAIAIVELTRAMDEGGPAAAAAGGGLRRAAAAALATRVEMRDGDGGLDVVLDELVELVVGRGEDPDAVAAAAVPARRGCGTAAGDGADAGATAGSLGARAIAEPECTLEDRRALAEQLRAAPEDLDGWSLAADLSSGVLTHAGERAYLCARQLAAGAVLRRAGRLVGPLRASTKTVREPQREPWAGELDLEATLDNVLGKPHPEPGDSIVQRRVDRRHQVVLMVDTSLSMAGEKMALSTVAAAVLALKLRPGDLAVVLFADGARVVSRFGEELTPAELVRRMLVVPCGGGTDIAAALQAGHAELQRGRDPGRSGLLVSDGVCTSGADPLPAATRFGPLHVLLMEKQAAARRPRGARHHLDRATAARRRGHRSRRRRWPRAGRRLPGPPAAHARRRRPGAALRIACAGDRRHRGCAARDRLRQRDAAAPATPCCCGRTRSSPPSGCAGSACTVPRLRPLPRPARRTPRRRRRRGGCSTSTRTILLLRFDVHPQRAEWLKSAPWVLQTALALEQELFLAATTRRSPWPAGARAPWTRPAGARRPARAASVCAPAWPVPASTCSAPAPRGWPLEVVAAEGEPYHRYALILTDTATKVTT